MELLSGWVKFHEILHVIFETTNHFFFKLRSWEITLLYLFSWNFILSWRRGPIRVPYFRLLISPNLHLVWILLLKVYKISAKKSTEELCFMTLKIDAKFEEKLICCFKTDKNLVNFDPSNQKSQKFALWHVLSGNIWPKKVQRSYLTWH